MTVSCTLRQEPADFIVSMRLRRRAGYLARQLVTQTGKTSLEAGDLYSPSDVMLIHSVVHDDPEL